MDLAKQLEYFRQYKTRLEKKIGRKRTRYIINKGVFIVSAGTNDVVGVFGITPPSLQRWSMCWLETTRLIYLSTSSLIGQFVPDGASSVLAKALVLERPEISWGVVLGLKRMGARKNGGDALQEQGATRIVVGGLPPAGCLPLVMTFHLSLIEPRSCVDSLSSIAKDFNQMLQEELRLIQQSKPGVTVAYADIYEPLLDQIKNPHKYGFEVVDKGCCGTGLVEGAFTCNALTPICSDRSQYVFWDIIHPTQRSYYFIFQSLRPVVDLITSAAT
ncbi:hypothetical protein Cgig2_000251 [Carnegiea gigantea]|uniref:GDSL esterase/lipase n=1 Tax=Carnegiea gigantea TaxID=171969 RepID=A0A9Q1JTA7_9CARY|nr:hypothetical protein Cgig2_000251 [Carnegiea gigantea]